MGYADPDQLGTGLRQRLYSRAFIIGDVNNPDDRFVYLVLDIQSGDTAVRYGVLEGLASLGSDYAVYQQSNVALTGTHSHSGPGAWLNYLLPQITSKGFDKQSYQTIVDGTLLSIQRAHESLSPGYLTFGSTNVTDANINRSPYAYLANPQEERQKYDHDVDKTLTLLRFQRKRDAKNIGILTWFPVHGTSMLGNNTLITGDNKGVASWLFEKRVASTEDADEHFVAGFSQSNVGDTSPNVLGSFCEDGSGSECDFQDSTCNGKTGLCHGRGPFYGKDDGGMESCFEIGRRQFEAAKDLYVSQDPLTSTSVANVHRNPSIMWETPSAAQQSSFFINSKIFPTLPFHIRMAPWSQRVRLHWAIPSRPAQQTGLVLSTLSRIILAVPTRILFGLLSVAFFESRAMSKDNVITQSQFCLMLGRFLSHTSGRRILLMSNFSELVNYC